MLARVLLAALLAGIAASLVMSAVQSWRVTPLITAAERFEDGHDQQAAHSHDGEAGQDGDHAGWMPSSEFERTTYTVISNMVVGAAFALLIAGVAVITGLPLTVSNGALWGLAGFIVFSLAPAAGLPPNLPGMPAADLVSRQVWWLATAAATSGGILLMVLVPNVVAKVAALVLIAAPHIIGAPRPDTYDSGVPASLATSFAANSLVTSAIFWIALGIFLGFGLTRSGTFFTEQR